ncbi:hypothetical protein HC752_21440 [Vibrio sp. S9_S30]|uniref:hypothetical protein n=1 Tax=Vibrio sp. S9_S30 TaxID=2720226 RepID=UPI0016812770|nr:hypothetical protein [Vibrio sp. S9_S30]MBD1559510.1 hypothetical protein [Vibrio sp. S9_S30]
MGVSESGQLIDSINQLTQTVVDKNKEIDDRVVQAENKFKQFVETSDERYMTRKPLSFKVGGDRDKFYPVFVPAAHTGIATISIGRHIHSDDKWLGAMSLRFLAQSYGWGGWAAINTIDVLQHQLNSTLSPNDIKNDGFFAKYKNPVTAYGIVFWLRGGCSYVVSSSLVSIDGAITFTEKVTSRSKLASLQGQNKVAILLSGVDYVESGYVEKWGIETARDNVQIPSLSIIRGVS